MVETQQMEFELVNAGGAVIDTVLYDDSKYKWTCWTILGNIAGPFAPDPSEGNTLARAVDCSDMTNDSSEFVETSDPSPGAENIMGVLEAATPVKTVIFSGMLLSMRYCTIRVVLIVVMSGLSCTTKQVKILMFRDGCSKVERPLLVPKQRFLMGQ